MSSGEQTLSFSDFVGVVSGLRIPDLGFRGLGFQDFGVPGFGFQVQKGFG